MGDASNPARLGELWDGPRLAAMLVELEAVRDLVVLSGGWAWHFMTPAHVEYKHAHDHKDADLFVAPADAAALVASLKARGYERTWTRFDGLPESAAFSRYVRTSESDGRPVKLMLDLFVEDVPSVEAGGFRVLEPKTLLAQYGVRHGSGQCFSVLIARDLVARGLDPLGHPEMADYAPYLAARPAVGENRPAKRKGAQR